MDMDAAILKEKCKAEEERGLARKTKEWKAVAGRMPVLSAILWEAACGSLSTCQF